MKPVHSIAFAVAFLLSLPLAAKEKVDPAVNASNKDAFETVSTWVRKQMDAGGRYSYVTPDERSKVNTRLDEMEHLFGDKTEVSQMSDADKMAMFNKQEEVNAILAKRDNERLICKNEKPIGSNIPIKTCQTAGEIEARRRNDSQYLRRTQGTPQLRSSGG